MMKVKIKSKLVNRHSLACLSIALAWLAFGQTADAAWNSVRANNRAEREEHGASRRAAQPQVSRGHEAQTRPEREHQLEPTGNPHRELDVGRRGEIDREARERRHMDFDEDRRHSYPWFGFHPGMIVGALPPAYTQVYVGGVPYYYDEGVYYESTPSGYAVVTPPPGVIVPALPPGAEPVAAGSTVYYYAGGAFYLPQPQGYMVVSPPLGVTVSTLPPGATPVLINGMQYYQVDGAYFMPVMQGGVVVYTTVQP